jgi:AcrR family transcriptional regulator
MKMKPTKRKKMERVSKDQWLAKALDILETNGVEAVKIGRLAMEFGISRSGFYWHFKNRQDLLEHLLDFWVREYTGVVSDNPDVKKLDPKKRLLTVMEMIRNKKLTKYDLSINAWAKVDPLARKVLKKTVNIRLGFLRSIFAELGFDGDELEMRTRLFVCYHSWEDTMFSDLSKKKQLQLQKMRHKFLLQK